ncbi:ubiquitin-conjugating enzyme E2 32 [Ricinus communis]|uniref:Non-canonical ubiquitin conjugating enzyme, putative n=1 Tax=Ricinus communis TaxID=3988 RepID=B9RZP3_RICCO|nr:ubiquitin-conjugating enzyme E2 32 [Ricinus communis]EEF43076.1 non-canonical ubiquitin conjugating enzyme, putative [Ricinus communis]|eukprot:XP_002519212.1 ubiquitin-conjugating enzyme E2 32 [Ricinus communis]
MAEDKYNLKNPAVKRILQEVKEMQSNPSDDFMSMPLEENIFEWQFAIRGPCDTEFEGGIYHGRIQLPSEYPFKPPSFLLLTPNGRFETQTKICLSISNHHPEHWQPSWSVRTALVALIAFMPTNPNGALGSLDYKKEERRALAIKSREAAPRFGTPERQKLIDEIHQYMLSKAPPVPQLSPSQDSEEHHTGKEDEAHAILQEQGAVAANLPNLAVSEQLAVGDRIVEEVPEAPVNVNPGATGVRTSTEIPARASSDQLLHRPETRVQRPADDRLFTWAAVGLTIAIVVLLLKKFLKSSGHGAVFMDGGS